MWRTLKTQGGPSHWGLPHICEFYLLDLYQVLTVNTEEKSHHNLLPHHASGRTILQELF